MSVRMTHAVPSLLVREIRRPSRSAGPAGRDCGWYDAALGGAGVATETSPGGGTERNLGEGRPAQEAGVEITADDLRQMARALGLVEVPEHLMPKVLEHVRAHRESMRRSTRPGSTWPASSRRSRSALEETRVAPSDLCRLTIADLSTAAGAARTLARRRSPGAPGPDRPARVTAQLLHHPVRRGEALAEARAARRRRWIGRGGGALTPVFSASRWR